MKIRAITAIILMLCIVLCGCRVEQNGEDKQISSVVESVESQFNFNTSWVGDITEEELKYNEDYFAYIKNKLATETIDTLKITDANEYDFAIKHSVEITDKESIDRWANVIQKMEVTAYEHEPQIGHWEVYYLIFFINGEKYTFVPLEGDIVFPNYREVRLRIENIDEIDDELLSLEAEIGFDRKTGFNNLT